MGGTSARPRTPPTIAFSIVGRPSTKSPRFHVEGASKSAIARLKRVGWNTVNRWLERTAAYCRQFNDTTITGLEIREVQADEIRTFSGGKDNGTSIFASLDVSSRLWPSTVVGRRSYRNTQKLFKDTLHRMLHRSVPLIVTDGSEYYAKVVRRLVGLSCLYGQVLKTRRNDPVIRVQRRHVVGADWRFGAALVESEDSSTLKTSFIERLNLTIRQGTSYLTRRSTCHARSQSALEDQIEILRFHYNFARPHRALKFGGETLTPAMQAGLVVSFAASSRRRLVRSLAAYDGSTDKERLELRFDTYDLDDLPELRLEGNRTNPLPDPELAKVTPGAS